MPNLETLHGNEEAIEHCSDEFFSILTRHATGVYGEIDWETARDDIEQTWQQLLGDGYTVDEAGDGLMYAEDTVKARDIQLSYMDVEA